MLLKASARCLRYEIYGVQPNHFVLFAALGYKFPEYFYTLQLLGILWELFEYYIANNQQIKKTLYQLWPIPKKYWCDTFEHSMIDILVNMIGYYVGNQF